MIDDENAAARVIYDHREVVKEIARQIRANPVTVEVEDGAVSATALANGQLTDIHISARAQRSYDNRTLSDLVLSAVREATRKAVETELGGLHGVTDGRASSLNDIFGGSIDAIAAEIDEEDRRERAEANRWSFRSEPRPTSGRDSNQAARRRPAAAAPVSSGADTPYDPLNPYGNGR